MDGTQPATKADLDALEQRIEKRFETLKDDLVEVMRDMQTELLRGFEAHVPV
ncbi:MAG: hypothetical protein JO051_05295 [Acidobacteriaceae bacterium]|nr:hypothetical protein [Acidobacteriaceae bacterium]